MEKVYIADDEKNIRDGIKLLIDWESYGCTICGEAGNGDEALAGIMKYDPMLVLMDIRMPGMSGLEVISRAREAGFKGYFVILSGYSDFTYAQTAMRLGVIRYLTKPIDEDELVSMLKDAKAKYATECAAHSREEFLLSKSKKEIIQDILYGKVDFEAHTAAELDLEAEVYQVVAYESFDPTSEDLPYQFSELFKFSDSDQMSFEPFDFRHKSFLLLRGRSAMDRLQRFISHYDSAPEKGSPLDTLFIAYGSPVASLSDLKTSYEQSISLLKRRFFCIQGQHVLGYEELPTLSNGLEPLKRSMIDEYCRCMVDYIQTFNRRKVAETLYSLEEYLYHVDSGLVEVKLFLIDLYLQIRDTMKHHYQNESIPFDSNTSIISFINSQHYLYEIIIYFSNHFEQIMSSLGNSSRDSVIDDILYYIDHNYHTNLKLEMIASLFGYNSSYLGKIFNRLVGENFNSYVDKVRINHAIELLKDGRLKVYEISERIGYNNVDYFHKKFKKYVGESPAEYRKKLGMTEE